MFSRLTILPSSSIASSLLFYYAGLHLDVHSFPTRRSSDLDGVMQVLPIAAQRGAETCALQVTGDVAFADRVAGAGDPISERDRKSTRLNSSHVAISYAVFCLKKKNTIPNQKSATVPHINYI